ncbi:hypothetical protein [Pseudomonas protegens]|uniref:hypothetical protein n=1 Tax=Pseudomonas protegens TaxID=380021 RepID=UPI002263BA4C|nr:hypothetical protein [Pseudomonas protegens]
MVIFRKNLLIIEHPLHIMDLAAEVFCTSSDDTPKGAVMLQELSLVCSILLRDGCDLMDVAGRQQQEKLSI